MTWAAVTALAKIYSACPVQGKPKTVFFPWIEIPCANGQRLTCAATFFNQRYDPHFLHFYAEDEKEAREFVLRINVSSA